jgi:hypothetical protein
MGYLLLLDCYGLGLSAILLWSGWRTLELNAVAIWVGFLSAVAIVLFEPPHLTYWIVSELQLITSMIALVASHARKPRPSNEKQS